MAHPDDKSDARDVVMFYEEFEVANNCKGMSAIGSGCWRSGAGVAVRG